MFLTNGANINRFLNIPQFIMMETWFVHYYIGPKMIVKSNSFV
jgi:hypothetical protein